MWTERYMALLKETHKPFFDDVTTEDEFVHALANIFIILAEKSLGMDYVGVYSQVKNKEPERTIAGCEENFEQGWSAIINDGMLLGFRRETETKENAL